MNQITLAATDLYALGSTSPSNATVGAWKFQIVGSTDPAWNGSIVVKARVNGADPPIPTTELVEVPFLNRNTNVIEDAGTPITADGIYEVQANGEDIFLAYTHTAGSAVVYPVPLEGTGLMVAAIAITPP